MADLHPRPDDGACCTRNLCSRQLRREQHRPDAGREYDIVGEILMPAAELQKITLKDLDAVKTMADTPHRMAPDGSNGGTVARGPERSLTRTCRRSWQPGQS